MYMSDNAIWEKSLCHAWMRMSVILALECEAGRLS